MKSRKLSPLQIELLKLNYKFRFTTASLIKEHKNKSLTTINQSLKTLLNKKYITRNYTPAYKLAGRSAEYYLTKEGIRYLRNNFNLNESVLHDMYKNKHAGEPFIQKSLLIYRVYISLQQQHATKTINLFTRSEIKGTEGFPAQLPDLYITNNNKEYFIDIFTESLFFYIKKRTDYIVKHYESDDWMEDEYPTILLVVPDKRLQAKTKAYAEKVMDDGYIEDTDLGFLISTIGELLASKVELR